MASRNLIHLIVAMVVAFTFHIHAQTPVQSWARHYSHDTHSSEDSAQAIVTDASGNVVAAGYTDEGVTGQDVLVIKYSDAGAPLWTNRYNGPANANDFVRASAIDGSGNVFVTGSSMATNGFYDYLTIAYLAVGTPLWTNRYNGTGNLDDQSMDVAVDANSNVFVTGLSWSGGSYDYVTIKYSGLGVPLWTNRYNGIGSDYDSPRAIAVDNNGNVIVTGQSVGSGESFNYDYLTIKYSSSGSPLWTNRYNGPNVTDIPTAITVDGAGDVIVTGNSSSTNSSDDYVTIKYSAAGLPQWTNRHANPGSDQATAIAVDNGGNVFVTGRSGSRDYLTIAYSGAGLPMWTNRHNGTGVNAASVSGLAVDSIGNVFVTGTTPAGTGNSFDWKTIAYSNSGVPLWTNVYSSLGNNNDGAFDLAIDSSGNVFVTDVPFFPRVLSIS